MLGVSLRTVHRRLFVASIPTYLTLNRSALFFFKFCFRILYTTANTSMHPAKKTYMKLDTDRLNWLRLGNEVTEWGNKFQVRGASQKK